MAKAIIPAVKGTRDFYPIDMAFRSWLYRAIRNVSKSFGYQEYDGPFIEKVELYAAKSGEELVKENFMFQDRGGEMVTLRPINTFSRPDGGTTTRRIGVPFAVVVVWSVLAL